MIFTSPRCSSMVITGSVLLIASIWPATVVTDDSLVQCVGELRAALDDHAQHLIRTVPRRGYRLDATVSPLFEAPEPMASSLVGVAVGVEAPAGAANESRPGAGVRWSRSHAVTVALLALAAAAATLWTLRPSPNRVDIDETIAARSTVAVLPFVAEAGLPVLRDVAVAAAEAITAQRMSLRRARRLATTAPPEEKPTSARSRNPWRCRSCVSASSTSSTSSGVCRSRAWSPEEPCMPGRASRTTGVPPVAALSAAAAARRVSGEVS